MITTTSTGSYRLQGMCSLGTGVVITAQSDIVEHSLLSLWWLVTQTPSEVEREVLAKELLYMDAKRWRRLGMLLFISDTRTVRIIVGVLDTLANEAPTVSSVASTETARAAVLVRVWNSDWRQFMIDKIADCHNRAMTPLTSTATADPPPPLSLETSVCLRLIRVLVRAFQCALTNADGDQMPSKTQVHTINWLALLSRSPVEPAACVASQLLLQMLKIDYASLEEQARRYLFAHGIFVQHLYWLATSMENASTTRLQRRRSSLTRTTSALTRSQWSLSLALLEAVITKSDKLFAAVAGTSRGIGVLDVALHTSQIRDAALQEHGLRVLSTILAHKSAAVSSVLGLATAIRSSGALITLCWLLGHDAAGVRDEALKLIHLVQRLSPTKAFFCALVEQNCAFILHLLALKDSKPGNPASPSEAFLEWMMEQASTQAPLLCEIADSVARSSDTTLQRNQIVSLFLLLQFNRKAHTARSCNDLQFVQDVVTSALEADGSGQLVRFLISVVLLCCNKSSMLKLDGAMDHGSQRSLRRILIGKEEQLNQRNDTGAYPLFALCCDEGSVVTVPWHQLAPHCARLRYFLLRHNTANKSMETTTPVRVDLVGFSVHTVEIFLSAFPKSQQDSYRMLKKQSMQDLMQLLRLAKVLECTKAWHMITRALSDTLDLCNWFAIFQLAMEIGHPILMQQALRVTAASTATRSVDGELAGMIQKKQQHQAILQVWRALGGS